MTASLRQRRQSRGEGARDRSSSPFARRETPDSPSSQEDITTSSSSSEEEEEETTTLPFHALLAPHGGGNIASEEPSMTKLAPLEMSLSVARALTNFVRTSAAYWADPQRMGGALERFIQQDKPTLLGPSRRILFFLLMGFSLSLFALWATEDEYYTGPKVDLKLKEESDFYPVHISFSNLSCYVNGPGWVIANISGDARPGRLMGILGSSGSGKTTLAHALLGRNRRMCTRSSGAVYLNGIPGTLDSFLDRVGFVPQDDVLYAEQTVLETIRFAAKARLPRYFSDELVERHVLETLETLDLTHVQNTRVGGVSQKTLSGGERKRVSIGMELVTLPSVLVLDEPTSGLDGYQSHKLIGTLKLIASRYNVSVVAVVHQPSGRSFQLFDDLLLLQRGRLVYFGERGDALSYFYGLKSLQAYFRAQQSHQDGGNSSALSDAEILLDVTTGFTSIEEEGDFLQSSFFAHQRQLLRERTLKLNVSQTHANGKVGGEEELEERCGHFGSEFLRNLCNIKRGLQSVLLPSTSGGGGERGETSLAYSKRAKSGIVFQSYQWWLLLCKLSLRRGLVLELFSIMALAFTCAFLRHFNRTWQRRHMANFYISVSIGMIAMMGAALEDDILPVRRAVSSGMLLGAHEFALVVYSLIKGFFTTHVFALVYFAARFAFDPPPSSTTRDRIFVCQPFSLHIYLRFHHLLQINYYCARGYGLLINVLVDHSEKKSMVACCALLIISHAFSLFSPQSSQLEKDGVYIFGRNLGPGVLLVASLSYVRYFLEAICLWDPDREDKVGRDFTLRFYSYREGREAACANTIVGLTVAAQIVRFVFFAFRNANDYASYHDAPAFIIFLVRILGVYLMLLIAALVYNDMEDIRATWNAAVSEALRTTIEQRRSSIPNQL